MIPMCHPCFAGDTIRCKYKHEFHFWSVHGIMNSSDLLQSSSEARRRAHVYLARDPQYSWFNEHSNNRSNFLNKGKIWRQMPESTTIVWNNPPEWKVSISNTCHHLLQRSISWWYQKLIMIYDAKICISWHSLKLVFCSDIIIIPSLLIGRMICPWI